MIDVIVLFSYTVFFLVYSNRSACVQEIINNTGFFTTVIDYRGHSETIGFALMAEYACEVLYSTLKYKNDLMCLYFW